MTGALIIAAVTALTGLILWLTDRRHRMNDALTDRPDGTDDAVVGRGSADDGDECCGMHLVCEKDSLLLSSDEIVYYDDEELDRFRGRSEDDYSPEEVEEIRDVMLTLAPGEAAGWARSMTLRGITLPTEIRDELLMIVAEQRERHKATT